MSDDIVKAFPGRPGDNVIQMFEGDPRCDALRERIIKLLNDTAIGMPLPSVIGVLELVKDEIKCSNSHG